MPTANGAIGNPRYDNQDPPEFSAHLTAISDFYATLASSVSNYSALNSVPNKYTGMVKTDQQTKGLWLYTGTSWTRINNLISDVADNYSSSAASDGTTMLAFGITSLPFATRLLLNATGVGGFRAGASKAGASWTSTSGSLNQVVLDSVDAPAQQWSGFGATASVELPANTTTTVRLVAATSNGPYLRANANVRRISTV